MIPVLIYLCIQFLGLGIDLSRHGQPKTGKHNFNTTVVAWLIVTGLLYWAGFYKPLFGGVK